MSDAMDTLPPEALHNLASAYRSKQGADFTIKCGDHEFKVHKWYLAQCQGYFSALLKQERFQESVNCELDLGNLGYDLPIITTVIEYCYGIEPTYPVLDCSSPMTKDAPTFWAYYFAAANYFQMDRLREIALEYLRNISGVNDELDMDLDAIEQGLKDSRSDASSSSSESSDDSSQLFELNEGEEEWFWSDEVVQAHRENARAVLEAAPVVYSTTTDSVRHLRDIVVQVMLLRYEDVYPRHENLRSILEKVPALSIDLSLKMAEFHRGWNNLNSLWKCRQCNAEMAMRTGDLRQRVTSASQLDCPLCGTASSATCLRTAHYTYVAPE